jgi:hypothetical protein
MLQQGNFQGKKNINTLNTASINNQLYMKHLF